jgi:hypothetical protein
MRNEGTGFARVRGGVAARPRSLRSAGRWLALASAMAATACGGTKAPAASPAAATPALRGQTAGAARTPSGARPSRSAAPSADAELVVHRDVVVQCPTLRLIRAHAAEFDAEMIWVAVLEAIADCMRDDGPLARQSLGVSGDEEHRHVVREVLAARGISPTRVIASPLSPTGVAECQGGADCIQRVEITIAAPPER